MGSEMCIRDSKWTDQGSAQGGSHGVDRPPHTLADHWHHSAPRNGPRRAQVRGQHDKFDNILTETARGGFFNRFRDRA